MSIIDSDIQETLIGPCRTFTTITAVLVTIGAALVGVLSLTGHSVTFELFTSNPVFLVLESLAVVSGGLAILTAGLTVMAIIVKES